MHAPSNINATGFNKAAVWMCRVSIQVVSVFANHVLLSAVSSKPLHVKNADKMVRKSLHENQEVPT